MKQTFYAYLCSRDGLTKPVLIGQFSEKDQNDAFHRAEKDPAVKRFLKNSQTGQLYVKVTDQQGVI